MSFGFGVGDVAVITKFARDVIQALRNEGGSKSQYREAIGQCESFLSVMNEVQRLDMTHTPDSFRQRLSEYSTGVQELVREFKANIEQYRKSMGKASSRGSLRSAPRKAQWAFMAADDLSKFRQSLTAQLDLVKIVIQMSILALIGSNAQQQEHSVGQTLNQHAKYPRPMLGSAQQPYPLVKSSRAHTLSDITDFVYYERLLVRPGVSLADQRRIYTLSNDGDPVSLQRAQQPSAAIAPSRSFHESTSGQRDRHQHNNNAGVVISNRDVSRPKIVDGVDEILQSLQLERLSPNERKDIGSSGNSDESILVGRHHSSEIEIDPEGLEHDQEHQNAELEADNHSRSSTNNMPRSKARNLDLSSPMSSAAGLTELIIDISVLYMKLRRIRNPPENLVKLVHLISNHTRLFQTTAEILSSYIMHSSSVAARIAQDVLGKGQDALQQAAEIVSAASSRKTFLSSRSMNKRAQKAIDEIRSIETDIAILLQIQQMESLKQLSDDLEQTHIHLANIQSAMESLARP